MKTTLVLVLGIFFGSIAHANCDETAAAADSVSTTQATATRTMASATQHTDQGHLNLKVEKMSCINCQHKMEGALKKLDGFKTAKFDLKAKTLRVDFDAAKLTEAQVLGALEGVGFPAKKL